MEDKGKGTDRWSGAVANLTEMASNLESLQKLLLKKAVYVDDETFARASLCSEQARTIKVTSLAFCFFESDIWFEISVLLSEIVGTEEMAGFLEGDYRIALV